MNALVTNQMTAFIAVLEEAGLPALRVAFSIAALVFLYAGVLIFRRRHQFFDRDPNVENDVPVVRHNHEEAIIFVWSGLILVLLSIPYQSGVRDMNDFKSPVRSALVRRINK
jgi:hypothetical protein